MATERMIAMADERPKKSRRVRVDGSSPLNTVRIPGSLMACMLDSDHARWMREKIEKALPAGDDRDMILAMILGRGDGLDEGWSGY